VTEERLKTPLGRTAAGELTMLKTLPKTAVTPSLRPYCDQFQTKSREIAARSHCGPSGVSLWSWSVARAAVWSRSHFSRSAEL